MAIYQGHKFSTAVLLNGPSGCGKDTLANLITQMSDGAVKKIKFAECVKVETAKFYGVQLKKARKYFDTRKLKDKPTELFCGKSPREALIYVAEHIMKEHSGKDIVARRTAAEMHKLFAVESAADTIITDAGFDIEAEVMAETADVVLIVQMHQKGNTFEGDSRDYINIHKPNVATVQFQCNHDETPQTSANRLLQVIMDNIMELLRFKQRAAYH